MSCFTYLAVANMDFSESQGREPNAMSSLSVVRHPLTAQPTLQQLKTQEEIKNLKNNSTDNGKTKWKNGAWKTKKKVMVESQTHQRRPSPQVRAGEGGKGRRPLMEWVGHGCPSPD